MNQKIRYQVLGGSTLSEFSLSDCRIEINELRGAGCSGFEEIVRKIDEGEKGGSGLGSIAPGNSSGSEAASNSSPIVARTSSSVAAANQLSASEEAAMRAAVEAVSSGVSFISD